MTDTSALEEQLKHIRTLIRMGYCAEAVYRTIGKHNGDLNGTGEPFWGFTQQAALDELVLAVCKLFIPNKGYDQWSIPHSIGEIKKLQLTGEISNGIRCNLGILKLGDSNNRKIITTNNKISRLVGILQNTRPTESNNTILENLLAYRNKKLAHYDSVEIPSYLPALEDIKWLLDWANHFEHFVRFTFIEGNNQTCIEALQSSGGELVFPDRQIRLSYTAGSVETASRNVINYFVQERSSSVGDQS